MYTRLLGMASKFCKFLAAMTAAILLTSATNIWSSEDEFVEFAVPEYDLSSRELYAKLIKATESLCYKEKWGKKEFDDSEDLIELMFWISGEDKKEYYGVIVGTIRNNDYLLTTKTITGYCYIDGRLVFIYNTDPGKFKLKLKENGKKRTFRFIKPEGYYDPQMYIFVKEGKNARYVDNIII